MFRYGLLNQALAQAIADSKLVTDEASAMEFAGHQCQVVKSSGCNIKITRPEDLALAEFYLGRQ